MLMKDKCKEIKRKTHKNSIKTLKSNCNQVSIELKIKQAEIVTLKRDSRNYNMRCEVRKEERKNDASQRGKKGWKENVSKKEKRKLDEKAAVEIGEMKQDLKIQKKFSAIKKDLSKLN